MPTSLTAFCRACSLAFELPMSTISEMRRYLKHKTYVELEAEVITEFFIECAALTFSDENHWSVGC